MRMSWSVERCIICLGVPRDDEVLSQLTDAHAIPEALGGRLSARFLCKRCNSEMGRVEGQLTRDVAIIERVRRLQAELPEKLVRGVLRHAGWFADSDEYGRLEGGVSREGEFSLRESSTILSDANTRRQIRAELTRRGVQAEEIEARVAEFEHADDGASLEIAPDFTVTKHIDLGALSFERTYAEPFAPRAIMLGIAYTFLALVLGARIYGAELEPARTILHQVVDGDTTAADNWPIDSLRTSSPAETKHALAVLRENGGVKISIRFFRELVWDVHFQNVEVSAEPFYLLDLVTGEESVA